VKAAYAFGIDNVNVLKLHAFDFKKKYIIENFFNVRWFNIG
jgi:hypothetical protein